MDIAAAALARLKEIDAIILSDARARNRSREAARAYSSLMGEKMELRDQVLRETGKVAVWTQDGYELRAIGTNDIRIL